MKEIIINNYNELDKLKLTKGNIILNLSSCTLNQKRRIIDVLCGFTLNSYIKKINKDMYEILI